MDRILIDTMHIASLLTEKDKEGPYFQLAQAIKDKKIIGIVSVVTLTELIKNLGEENRQKVNDLTYTNLVFINVTPKIATRAGNLRLRYDIPTIDSLIAATGIVENIKHVLTTDKRHFDSVKNLIKIISLQKALDIAK